MDNDYIDVFLNDNLVGVYEVTKKELHCISIMPLIIKLTKYAGADSNFRRRGWNFNIENKYFKVYV